MFQSFTNYLGSLIGVENSSSSSSSSSISGTPVRTDDIEVDDWILVNPLTTREQSDEEDEEDDEDDVPPLERRSSASSLQSDSVMEESWFVTPPPCFTSEGPALSTSPLENLLIEHPSMSVYHINTSSRKYSVSDFRSDDVDDDDIEDFENMGHVALSSNWKRLDDCDSRRFIMFARLEDEYEDVEPEYEDVEPEYEDVEPEYEDVEPEYEDEKAEFIENIGNMPAYNTRVLEIYGSDTEHEDKLEKEVEVVENLGHLPAQTHSRQFLDKFVKNVKQQQMQRYQFRQAQKLKVQNSTKELRHSCIERNNKARELNSRNHQQRRGERSQGATRSCANNNRKC